MKVKTAAQWTLRQAQKLEPTSARTAERVGRSAAHETATRDFDTTIRALAGGALAVSIAFVHQIAKHPRHDWLLGVAWGLFAAALAVNMLSFLVSERAIPRLLGHMAEKAPTEEPKRPRVADRLNWVSAATAVGGLGFLVLFAVLNV